MGRRKPTWTNNHETVTEKRIKTETTIKPKTRNGNGELSKNIAIKSLKWTEITKKLPKNINVL